ncbi:MAG: MoaD/ThiS family protein [Promethearchaeota archaeon]
MAIRVKAKFYANMRELLGKKELEIVLDSSGVQTIRDVIDKIDELEGKHFKEKIMGTKDRPRRSIRIVLNGKQIDFLERFDTVVNEGDNVSFFPLIGAG